MKFYYIGKLKIPFGLYRFYLNLIDAGFIKTKSYHSELYKYSTIRLLVECFGGHAGHGTDIKKANLGLGLIHASMINNLRPERVLCIGSERGFIPAICALACKNNHRGHVDFVDAGKDVNDNGGWGGVGFWKKNDPDKHFSLFGLNKYITTHVMTSEKFAQKYPQRKYDYIYIDADHSYKGVKSDYKIYWNRLVSGGMMSFHDIKIKGLNNGEEFGVWKLWKEIPESSKFSFDTFDNAIGYIQKQ